MKMETSSSHVPLPSDFDNPQPHLPTQLLSLTLSPVQIPFPPQAPVPSQVPPPPQVWASPSTPAPATLSPVQIPFPPQAPIPSQVPPPPQVWASPSTAAPATTSSSNSLPEHFMYKSRLQDYTQRLGIQLPIYQTTSKGSFHLLTFSSSVFVNGSCYGSANICGTRKEAEQDAARVALMSIRETEKEVAVPHEVIIQDKVFCKSILHEYAAKTKMDMPTYCTVEAPGLLLGFQSSLEFNSVHYTGEVRRNKKEAEHSTARAVIQSLLGGSETAPLMLEVINSKQESYAALHKIKDPRSAYLGLLPPSVNTGDGSSVLTNGPAVAVLEASSGMLRPHHEFMKPKPTEPSSEAISQLPITFVRSVNGQSSNVVPTASGIAPTSLGISPTSLGIASSSKKLRKKKKAKKKSQNVDQMTESTPCSN